MSIIPLVKVTFISHGEDKEGILEELQDLGALHLVPLTAAGEAAAREGPSPHAREALQFLLSCPWRRRQVKASPEFSALEVERQALEVKGRLRDLREERDFLIERIRDLKPWGDFELPPLEEMGGQRLWFFPVPSREMKAVEATGLRWEVVRRDNRFHYVAVISPGEPEGMPVPRTRTGAVPLSKLEERLDAVELAIEDAEAERAGLTRWCLLLAKGLNRLEDREMRDLAAAETFDLQPLFALQAWAPRERIGEIQEYAAGRGMALLQEEPEPGEDPPTRLENSQGFDAGEMLVNFYQTPGYWTWDPSSVVLVSFALFFAMILSDGGYAALLGLLTLFLWKRLGKSEGGRRFRNLLAALSVTSLAYGVLVASYFGVSPEKESFLGKLQVFDVKDFNFMMMLSVVVGVTHLVIANIMESHRRGRTVAALPPLGWALGILGGFGVWVGSSKGLTALMVFSMAALAAGMVLVVLYTAAGERPLPRALKGLMGLAGISGAFGDVLSYLRLFALGLASAQLAASFNDMASGIREALPGIGLLFALLVLLIGHSLNLVLSVASGVIHGLRLNVIEFFKWGLKEEGHLFRPFRRKESVPWNP